MMDWKGRALLVVNGIYRGILSAFIASFVCILVVVIWFYIIQDDPSIVDSFSFIFSIYFVFCGLLTLLTSIPGALGGIFLSFWLLRDARKGNQTVNKTFLKGTLVGCGFALATLAFYVWINTLVPVSESQPMQPHNAIIAFIKTSPVILLAGTIGGAYASWKLSKDIKNRVLNLPAE